MPKNVEITKKIPDKELIKLEEQLEKFD